MVKFNNEKINDENLEITNKLAIDDKVILIRKGKKKYFLGIMN